MENNNQVSETLLIPYRKGEKWGYCSVDKKIMIACVYDKADFFIKEGFANVISDNKKSTIDRTGKALPFTLEDNSPFVDGLAVASCNRKFGIVNTNAEIVIPFKYDSIHKYCEGFAKVEIDNKYGFIDRKGNIVVPFEYDCNVYDFSDGLAQVTLNGRNGFVNIKGEIIVPVLFKKKFTNFSEGYSLMETAEYPSV